MPNHAVLSCNHSLSQTNSPLHLVFVNLLQAESVKRLDKEVSVMKVTIAQLEWVVPRVLVVLFYLSVWVMYEFAAVFMYEKFE